MTAVSYHSTTISDKVSSREAATVTTSSQILLSRDIADTGSDNISSSLPTTSVLVTSVSESDTKHIMTLRGAVSRTASSGLDGQTTSQHHQIEHIDSTCRIKPTVSSHMEDSAHPSPRETPIIHQSPQDTSPSTSFDSRGLAAGTVTVQPEVYGTKTIVKKRKERGRSLERGPRYPNPLAQAELRFRKNDAAIELDSSPIGKRISRSSTFFEDPTDPCAVLDDNLLEPCPHVPKCANVSEVLADPSRIFRTGPAFTTAFRDCQLLGPAPTLPPEPFSQLIPEINHLECLAIKSSSPHWSRGEPSPKRRIISTPSAASKLPAETIQQIYYNLTLTDFNSARHTCRSWFINSLKRSLLEEMLKRGGFSSSIQHDLTANHLLSSSKIMVNDEWLMSKRISRECALGPDWSGNGLKERRDCKLGHSKKSAFLHTATVDFTEVAVHHHNGNSAGTFFTVSSCGRFLMAANGCLIYIYELNQSHHSSSEEDDFLPGSLRPVTSIICPSRVLACSMDTSSHRYAIAVLLDGRMGLVCDITALNSTPSLSETKSSKSCHSQDTGGHQSTSLLDRVSLNSSGPNLGPTQPPKEPPGATIAARDNTSWQDIFRGGVPRATQTVGPSFRHGSVPHANTLGQDDAGQKTSGVSHEKIVSSNSMRIENGPRSLYRNLCSDDDPPRSVAICPQRRCVAFGCSSGIELHWVDALTGQDLNRWFPLTAPSDFLFFLPPRKSVDSAKKLRLISSAARPNERPAIAARAFGGGSRSSPFWERLGGWSLSQPEDGNDLNGVAGGLTRVGIAGLDAGARGFSGRTDCSDHYRAVPLSDGYHILFTDPATGILCLGSDAPVGGPTKLLRKIWFQGPRGAGSPIIYAGGSNLGWGVRVVAAYGEGSEQSLWLFSVPSDIFTSNQASLPAANGSIWIKSRSKNENANTSWVDWWPANGLQEWLSHTHNSMPVLTHQSVWPVKIRGQELGKCSGVVDLAVDPGSSMTIWAFSNEGVATIWRIDNGQIGDTRRRWVMRDGTIREDDCEGDVEMSDSSSSPEILSPPLPLQPESLDGTTSLDSSAFSISRRAIYKKGRRCRTKYDGDGDVIMDDPRSSANDEDCTYEEVAWAYCQTTTVNQIAHWTRRGYKRLETDFIARVDVEIH